MNSGDCCSQPEFNKIEWDCECTGGGPLTFDVCKEICGSGYNIGWYECDDGNLEPYDGCD